MMARITPRAKAVCFQPGLSDKTYSLMAEQLAATLLGSDKARRQIQRKDEYRLAREYFEGKRRAIYKSVPFADYNPHNRRTKT